MEFDDSIYARASRLSVAEQMRAYKEDVRVCALQRGRSDGRLPLRADVCAGHVGASRSRAFGRRKRWHCRRQPTCPVRRSRRTPQTWMRSVRISRRCAAPAARSPLPSGGPARLAATSSRRRRSRPSRRRRLAWAPRLRPDFTAAPASLRPSRRPPLVRGGHQTGRRRNVACSCQQAPRSCS